MSIRTGTPAIGSGGGGGSTIHGSIFRAVNFAGAVLLFPHGFAGIPDTFWVVPTNGPAAALMAAQGLNISADAISINIKFTPSIVVPVTLEYVWGAVII